MYVIKDISKDYLEAVSTSTPFSRNIKHAAQIHKEKHTNTNTDMHNEMPVMLLQCI